uniref:CSON011124 protein n=1 Tax=Culicoides sonorensis TaxID=179676 RepID=A0A336LFZ8_CULSO
MSLREINNLEVSSVTSDANSFSSISSQNEGLTTALDVISSQIRTTPHISDVNLEGCSQVTIGNQTHINGNVIIRNILTRSVNESNEIEFNCEEKTKDSSEIESNLNENSNKKIIIWMIFILILISFGILTGIYVFKINEDENFLIPRQESSTMKSNSTTVPFSTRESRSTPASTIIKTTPFPLTIVSRNDWQKIRNFNTKQLKVPVKEIIISHTGKILNGQFEKGCQTETECRDFAVKLEEFYVKRQTWSDLPYNFLIGHDGLIYEGRGWKYDGSFKSAVLGDDCLSIAFIGNYNLFKLSPNQKQLLFALIDDGISSNYIDKTYKIFGLCQIMLIQLQSPGKFVYDDILKWTHWSNYSDVRGSLRNCDFDSN